MLLLTILQGFFLIAAALTQLTRKEEHFVWTNTCEHSFETLKNWLTSAPVLSLLEGHDDFVVYSDASGIRLACVWMPRGRVLVYAP